MPTVIPVTSLADDPRLAPYANQRDAHLRAPHLNPDLAPASPGPDAAGLFVAEGELVVRTLLHSPYDLHSLLVRDAFLPKLAADLPLVPPGVPIFTAPQETLDAIVGFHIHRGVLACGRRARRSPSLPIASGPLPLAPLWPLPSLLSSSLLLLLEDLSNHDNVGAIFRNVGCLAPTSPDNSHASVILSPRSCDPLYRKALRVSMGHALRVPFAIADDWPATLDAVSRAGFTLAALTPDAGAVDLASVRWPARTALLLGAEGPGLRPETLARADLRVRIPMAPGADSLNVATAAAVALASMRLV